MKRELFLNDKVVLWPGDSRTCLAYVNANSIDSVVTDPPYALTSMTKPRPDLVNASNPYARKQAERGFMGKQWDTGEAAFDPEFWKQILRVLKPGGHVVAFGGDRTVHRLTCAIEDAGFEIRGTLAWIFGSGFPKGLNVVNNLIRLAICQSSKHARLAVQSSKSIRVRCEGVREPIAVAVAQILPEGELVLLTEIGGGVALHVPTVMWPSEWMATIGLNMTWSWSGLLDDACTEASKCITEMESERTTDLTIWNWLIGLHTSANTTPVSVSLTNGSPWPAAFVANSLNGSKQSYSAIQIVTALGNAGENPLKRFDGFNIALKPAMELICLARKPLIGTVAENVLEHGTGAINVDGCRVAAGADENFARPVNHTGLHEGWDRPWKHDPGALARERIKRDEIERKAATLGRWPANVLHDGSAEVVGLFPGDCPSSSGIRPRGTNNNVYGEHRDTPFESYGDSGSAARFFYTSKADADDRLGFTHPTIKPVDLMQWLVRLVTPKGGMVLDPFAGTGTTAEAAFREGMRCMLLEREPEYQGFIRERMRLVMAGPDERSRETAKRKPEPPREGLLALMAAE
jgi:DNA modification methylase